MEVGHFESPITLRLAFVSNYSPLYRTLIGFGAVPGCIALYYRLTIPETPRYTFDVAKDVEKADQDAKYYVSGKRGEATVDEVARIAAAKNATEQMTIPKASFGDFFRHYSKRKNAMLLAGTALSWFFLDVAYYGLSLNNATILQAIGYSTSNAKSTYEILYNTAIGNLIIVLAGAVPGYWVTVATVDTIGRKPIQLAGFAILTVLFIAMGFGYNRLGENGLLAIYVLAQFFFNFGPNSTTFIVPGECFPTRYRSTSHGISAAAGKIGSIIGRFSPSVHFPFFFLCISRTCANTLFFPPTQAKAPSPLCALAAPPAPAPAPGSTTCWRFSRSLCFWAASRRFSSRRRSARRSRSCLMRTTMPLDTACTETQHRLLRVAV